jgi:hypothetical protein
MVGQGRRYLQGATIALAAAACSGRTEVAGGSAGSATTGAGGGSVTGVTGGTLDMLHFAVVGDTRPPNEDDTAGYPQAVITKIWQDVEAFSPRPAFAVTTGDYMFAQPYGSQGSAQLDIYLGARAAFTNVVFPAMGNHECTGATASNCGAGNTSGLTANFNTFMSRMLMPLGTTKPYYTVDVASPSGAWTAKLVFIAANAWDSTQAAWLDAELAKPTTYTFAIRHEDLESNTAPGVSPSEAILAKHPYTLKIVGHTHTFRYDPVNREVVVGNGGAPLSGSVNYGYLIATQRADGAIVLNAYDYMSNASVQTFAVKADGSSTN